MFGRKVFALMLQLVQTLYTAETTATNGRNGHVRSSDGSVDLNLSAPSALGGSGKPGANPEQLFAAGYSACFIGAMQYQAMQQKLRPGDIRIDTKVAIGPAEGNNGFTLAVTMDVHVAELNQAAAEKLVADAHRTCPYSNATRGNIDVTLIAHGAR
jgi:lipoyl-dependent peroxiredoxin